MVLSRPLPYGADLCRGSARLFHSAQSGSCGERREWPPDFQGGPKQSDDSGGHCSGRPAAARRGQIAAGLQHRQTARHLRESLILVSGFSTPGFATPFKGLDEVVDSWPRSAFPACVKLSADKPCVVSLVLRL